MFYNHKYIYQLTNLYNYLDRIIEKKNIFLILRYVISKKWPVNLYSGIVKPLNIGHSVPEILSAILEVKLIES